MTIEIVRRAVPAAAAVLVAAGVDPVLARVYAARGVGSATAVAPTMAALPRPATLLNAGAAAARLAKAIRGNERIVIVADYDADGATACALGVRALRLFGADVDFVVPNRFEHGYGLTPEIVALAAERAPRLIVTVDNGIASVDGVTAAADRGIDVLITDHHLPGERLPAPAIIVNPNQPGCDFASKHIAGVGVMFYVLVATRALLREEGHFRGRETPNLGALLDLVALGTVADVVRLDDVNRILVEQGLRRIRAGAAQPGVAALFAVAGRDASRARAADLGFIAGPRLNAAGRLADMSLGIRCLLEDDPPAALALARELDRMNVERRDIGAGMEETALAALDELRDDAGDHCSYCIYRPEWHQGVVGIVAARIKDRYHRPAIVFANGNDGELKGSGRSIAGFHLRDALDLVAKRVPGVITRFGGHAYAAGVSIVPGGLEAFAAALERVARERLTDSDLRQTIESDGTLGPGELTFGLAERLAEPVWGQGFAAPSFDDTFDVLDQRIVGGAHSRLMLGRGAERYGAILFRHALPLPARVRAVFHPEINEFQGTASLQLRVLHWEVA